MYKVLIADDEFLVRVALTNTINWNEYGLELVGAVGDGAAALEHILQYKPDIVITDLTMPKLNGIELIKAVKERNIEAEFIVLSCHNEFEYTKQALQLGVFDYILKLSMSMNELQDILQRVKVKIENKREEQKKSLKLQSDAGKNIVVEDLIAVMGNHSMTGDNSLKKNNSTMNDGTVLNDVCYKIIVMKYTKKDELNETQTNQQIYNIGEQICIQYSNSAVLYYKNAPILCLWDTFDQLNLIIRDLQRECEKYLDVILTIGVGMEVDHYGKMRDSYQQACQALSYDFYTGVGSVNKYGEHKYKKVQEISFEIIFKGFDEIIGYGINSQLNQFVSKVCQEILEKREIEPVVVRQLLHELIFRIKQRANEMLPGAIGDNIESPIYEKIHQLEYLEDIKDTVLYFMEVVIAKMNIQKQNTVILQAKQYVKEHLSDNLKVMHVSSILGMNSDYFSHLFKKETEMNYIDYVNQVRIEKACQLINHRNDKIYEIGEQVGYENTNYFVKVFKKIVGVTPLEYKKQQEGNGRASSLSQKTGDSP